MNEKPKLGFVGIGLMGEAMVRRLLDRAIRSRPGTASRSG